MFRPSSSSDDHGTEGKLAPWGRHFRGEGKILRPTYEIERVLAVADSKSPTSEILGLMDRLAEHGVRSLVVLIGEPTPVPAGVRCAAVSICGDDPGALEAKLFDLSRRFEPTILHSWAAGISRLPGNVPQVVSVDGDVSAWKLAESGAGLVFVSDSALAARLTTQLGETIEVRCANMRSEWAPCDLLFAYQDLLQASYLDVPVSRNSAITLM